tara:strand:+ start:169 stop:2067 length:1899 start_codon:yes stop_codon:yes gene_type:complete
MQSRNIKLIPFDVISSVISLYIAFLIRFEFNIPEKFLVVFFNWLPWFIASHISVFYFSNIYSSIIRYTSLFDLYRIVCGVIASCIIGYLSVFLVYDSSDYPRSILLLYFILYSLNSIALRLLVRVYFSHYKDLNIFNNKSRSNKKKFLLIGAGNGGEKIAREILTVSNNRYSLAGFLDDDIKKQGAYLHGKKIYGPIKNLRYIDIEYDEIIITTPGASGNQMRKIVKLCKQTEKPFKTVPGFDELLDGEVTLDSIRDVSYSDLLGRQEVHLDMVSIKSMIQNKRILITGAGGSIGFELVKQCLQFDPSEIICIETNEEKIYLIEQFAETINTKTVIKTALASVNNKRECEKIFIDNRPHIVYHAAAYKHVPIQELHPWNAINTNLGGTKNIVELADKYEVSKFVLVSTDKAVNPVNVMGASKRAAELLILSFNNQSNTTFISVRFGNVLGSSGSAIPTFQKQISEGGPITITHPEMTRYFMSIQEASQLILQCGAYGKDGEIFLLEMGKPIKIVDMARDLIRLSGLEPGVDIPIVFTGLRPGEKLYEELQLNHEKKVTTKHRKIMILQQEHPTIPWDLFLQSTIRLLDAAEKLDAEKIQSILKQVLPSYQPNWNFGPSQKPRDVNYLIKGEA